MPRTRTIEIPLVATSSEPELGQLAEGLADEDPGVREDCAQRLANLRHREAATYLRHALDDDEESVRMWGAYGLGLLARSEDQGELQRAMREDESPLVRLWATFGCAHAGDVYAAHALVEMLDLPDLELRSNAVDALVTLSDPSTVRPLLERRLSSTDERRRVWAAAILHRWGHRGAFELWREGLLHPRTRVHAALVSPYLQSDVAARELVRVGAELPTEELEAPVAAANDLPLAELLSTPLLELGLDALLQRATAGKDADEALRADLLLMALRTPYADPEVVARLFEHIGQKPVETLGAWFSDVMLEQSPPERLRLLARITDFAPETIVPALERFGGEDRDRIFDLMADAAGAPSHANALLSPLLELLRTSPWSEQLADLPDDPWAVLEVEAVPPPEDEEAPIGPIIERMAAGEEVEPQDRARAEALLQELEMTAEEFAVAVSAEEGGAEAVEPPTGERAALRALCLAAVVDRAMREQALAEGRLDAAGAAEASVASRAWLSSSPGLEASLTQTERALLDAAPGAWSTADAAAAPASIEALAMLLWSTQSDVTAPPSPDAPSSAGEVMSQLPVYRAFDAFVGAATQVDSDTLDGLHELYETLLWRAEQEETARRLLNGEEVSLPLDEEALLEELRAGAAGRTESETTDRPNLLAEALRLLGRRAAQRLAEAGLVMLRSGDFGFMGQPVSALDDALLGQLRGMAEQRFRALVWLAGGGDWDALAGGSEEDPG